MRRLLLGSTVMLLLVAVAVLSGNTKLSIGDLFITVEDRNPWTNLRLNNDPAEFQFVVVSDRTGGHRASIFSKAVEQINLLQPEFVLSVGDLIEGYSQDNDKLNEQWREFQGYVHKLEMPFFYVPGNHDLSNPYQETYWKEKFGRRYYHFVYRDVLFLLLNSEDPAGKDGGIGVEQLAYIQKTLEENRQVHWTVVCLHRPIWAQPNLDKNGWLDVEKLLNGRPYTVFAGHVHRFQKFVRNGQNYYQMATTGGGSRLRGVRYGEFDQLVWVTMKKSGPVIANIMLDGIYPEDMSNLVSNEAGVSERGRRPTFPVKGKVFFDGTPAAGAQVVFHYVDPATKKTGRLADAFAEPDGTFVLTTYNAFDGAPSGDYAVTVIQRQPWLDAQGKPGRSLLPDRYAKPETTDLRARVGNTSNDIVLELKR